MKLKIGHCSMQYSDTSRQMKHDAEALFSRNYDWITGTEAGEGAGPLGDHLYRAAKRHGYKFHLPRQNDSWIAVNKDMIDSDYHRHYRPVIPSSRELGSSKAFGPKGVASVEFNNNKIGEVNIAASHYLPGGNVIGRQSIHGGVNHYEWNRQLAREIGLFARKAGRGKALAFYGGDQNIVDKFNDTFFGYPLISCWDELNKYPNTGHGNIDLIAKFSRDGRTTCRGARVYRDKQLKLFTDHFLVEAVYRVRNL